MTTTQTMRDTFITETARLLDREPRLALVLAAISADAPAFVRAAADHPDRVVNVGIREQLMIGVAGGMAQTGLRPIAHTYVPFLIERAFEQVKLDFGHQGVSGILVSVGASYDWAEGGFTHFSPRDVAVLDSIPNWRVHVPGHPDEVTEPLRAAAADDDSVYIRLSLRSNTAAQPTDGRLTALRHGREATIVAVGPMLDNVLAATAGLDATIAYTNRPRPFDTAGLRALLDEQDTDTVIIVEPYLAGTSDWIITDALSDRPHRLKSLGVGRDDLHAFGTADDHDHWHGLDPAGLKAAITDFLH